MASPFPGMDPYLESPHIWPDVHHRLISEIQSVLNPSLRPNYVARVEMRVYISDEDDPARELIVPDVRIEESLQAGGKKTKASNGVAVVEPLALPDWLDDEIKEARIEIYHRESGKLVTIIELLSPANKVAHSRGRESLLQKRRDARDGNVHWVEIDLLRAGLPSVARTALKASDYRVLRYRARKSGQYWPISIRQVLPPIGVPLRGKDADVPLDLNTVLRAAYENAAYDLSIDYTRDASPPLRGPDKTWADRLLRSQGLR
jgi:hypothetical protein